MKLTGIKLKMSSAYLPEMDGSSKRSNKSMVQCLCYHVDCNQTSWVKALPLVHFNLMNTVNMFTGFSPFQLQMGQSPCLIPPLTAQVTPDTDIPHDDEDSPSAITLIEQLNLDIMEAQNNLLAAKVSQSEFTNQHWSTEDVFMPGDKVMLSTENCHCKYMQAKSG